MSGREIVYGFTILAAVLQLTTITECIFHIVFLMCSFNDRIENSNSQACCLNMFLHFQIEASLQVSICVIRRELIVVARLQSWGRKSIQPGSPFSKELGPFSSLSSSSSSSFSSCSISSTSYFRFRSQTCFQVHFLARTGITKIYLQGTQKTQLAPFVLHQTFESSRVFNPNISSHTLVAL